MGSSHSAHQVGEDLQSGGTAFLQKILAALGSATSVGADQQVHHTIDKNSQIPCFVARQCPFVSETWFFCLASAFQPTL